MSEKVTYLVNNSNAADQIILISQMINKGLWRGAVEVVLQRPDDRTPSQNNKLWPMLRDIKNQVDWYGHQLTEEDWKDVFTSAMRRQRAVPGLDGGFVVLGMRTSRLKKQAFCDLIEVIFAFGTERQVRWSEQSLKAFDQYREAQIEQTA